MGVGMREVVQKKICFPNHRQHYTGKKIKKRTNPDLFSTAGQSSIEIWSFLSFRFAVHVSKNDCTQRK